MGCRRGLGLLNYALLDLCWKGTFKKSWLYFFILHLCCILWNVWNILLYNSLLKQRYTPLSEGYLFTEVPTVEVSAVQNKRFEVWLFVLGIVYNGPFSFFWIVIPISKYESPSSWDQAGNILVQMMNVWKVRCSWKKRLQWKMFCVLNYSGCDHCLFFNLFNFI